MNKPIIGYKLFSLKKDGSIGSLFIDRTNRLEINKWYTAKAVKTSGYAFRPGWHICEKKEAPHLSKKNRIWCKVKFYGDVQEHKRPQSQGGLWYTAKYIKIVNRIYE